MTVHKKHIHLHNHCEVAYEKQMERNVCVAEGRLYHQFSLFACNVDNLSMQYHRRALRFSCKLSE